MPHTEERLIAIGRVFFATGMMAWGVQHLVAGDFVTRVVPQWPDVLAPRQPWAWVLGVFLVVAGAAIATGQHVRIAALSFAALTLMSFALLHVPLVAADHLLGGRWTSAGKALVMSGGALAIVAAAGRRDGFVLWGRFALGAFLTLCGIQHFMYVPFVASLIPSWIPGAVFWTYFAGVALVAGGLGLILPFVPRLSALLSGLMIFSWVFLIHVPLVLRDVHDASNMAAVFEALAFSGVAFLLAGLLPRTGPGRAGR